jgi:type II secretory pathway pseudopilin PulG
MQLAKGRLQQALDGIGQRSEARGAQLTAAGVAGALAIVDQERAQQAEAAAAEARAAIDAAAQGAGAPFQQALARGQALLGVDWLVDNDTALPPPPAALTDKAATP